MPYAELKFPPGIVRPGTLYDARGRYYDSELVRWLEGALQPVGGWAALSGAGSVAVGGPVRGMRAWKRNNGDAKVALGTPTALKVYSAGTLTDITPAGFTPGAVSASGSYYSRVEANSWQLDAYGEDLVACAYSDGRIWYYDSSAGTIAALTNAPTGCKAVVVTPERFVVALAASGDGRLVKWSDQEGETTWTAATTNQAGDFPLSTDGQLMAGRRGKNETLLWTDLDLWAMRYIGGDLVYSFQPLGSSCGAISRRAMAMIGGQAFWMGPRGFFAYDGYVREIPCEVQDYVFNRLNREQASKVAAWSNSDFNEVWWFYPSDAGTENDSYVQFNYADGWWAVGTLARTDGIERGFLQHPLLADADGCVYEHENGVLYADEGGSPSYTPFAESGPMEIGRGDQVVHARQYIPDEETLGEVNTRLYTRFYPTGAETTHGPYTNANPTDVRITGRQVRVRHTQVTGDWRVGTPRLEVVPGGLR